jgi:hypothetical protein
MAGQRFEAARQLSQNRHISDIERALAHGRGRDKLVAPAFGRYLSGSSQRADRIVYGLGDLDGVVDLRDEAVVGFAL